MKKTKRWLAVSAPFSAAPYLVILAMSYLEPGFAGFDEALAVLLASVAVFAWVPHVAVAVLLMLRWTARYNLENFGARSRKEWRPGAGSEPGRP